MPYAQPADDSTAASLAARAAEVDDLKREVAALHDSLANAMFHYGSCVASQPAVLAAMREAFVRYFEERAAGRAIENPRVWVLRSMRQRLDEPPVIAPAEPEGVSLPEETATAADPAAQTWRKIESLVSPRELECLRLRHAGFGYAEIASIMQIHIGTVSTLLRRGFIKAHAVLAALDMA